MFKTRNQIRFLSGVAILHTRKFLKLDGLDAAKFLQGLTTNDIQSLYSNHASHGQYSSFLNAQGRLMYDAFIYRTLGSGDTTIYYIECDGQIQERLFLHLQTFNLRTKTKIKMVTEEEDLKVAFSSVPLEGALASVTDNRTDWSFTRYLFRNKDLSVSLLESAALTFSEGRYNRERVLKGVPEGAFEIPSRQAIPLEFNVDLMGGIDFNKGCYLGQELVIRTHQRGVVRKRILPLRFHSLNSATVKPERPEVFEFDAQSPITRDLDKQSEFLPTALDPSTGKLKILSRTDVLGKLVMAQGNVGLGMMKLEALKDQTNRCNLAVFNHIESDWILSDALIPECWPTTIFDNL